MECGLCLKLREVWGKIDIKVLGYLCDECLLTTFVDYGVYHVALVYNDFVTGASSSLFIIRFLAASEQRKHEQRNEPKWKLLDMYP